MTTMIQGLVLTHGGIGRELIKVVELIMGPVEGLRAESNQGRSAKETTQAVTGWLAGLEVGAEGVVFIDDYGGSCATAARLGLADQPRVAVISGVNLTMLLAFVTWREELERPELVQRIVDKGRQAVTVVGAAR
jgi:mannose/fructose-specific phosphotransferase system component IIA